MPSYITAFQSSPVSTWNTVTSAQMRVSKLCRGDIAVVQPAHFTPEQLHAKQRKDEDGQDDDEGKFSELDQVR